MKTEKQKETNEKEVHLLEQKGYELQSRSR